MVVWGGTYVCWGLDYPNRRKSKCKDSEGIVVASTAERPQVPATYSYYLTSSLQPLLLCRFWR